MFSIVSYNDIHRKFIHPENTLLPIFFNDNGNGVKGDMKAVIVAILLDDVARNPSNLSNPQFGKVREPILRFTAWAKAFNVSSANGTWDPGWVRNSDWGLGQAMLHSPSVFNFFRPGYVPPSSDIANAGLVAPELQLTNEVSVFGYINFMQNKVYTYSSLTQASKKDKNLGVNFSTLLQLASDASKLVDEISLLLTAGQLSSNTLTRIKTAVGTVRDLNNRVHAAVMLVLAAPEFIVSK
jgi:hypothetical protein